MQKYHLYGIVGVTPIPNLRYADDTALIEGSHEKKMSGLPRVSIRLGKNLHLKLKVKKTKVLVAGKAKEECTILIDGQKVKQVESFKYLDSTKTATAYCTSDIKSRIAIAKWRMIELHNLWNNSNLPFQLKVKLVKP